MKRTMFRRGSALNTFLSLWVALSFVFSLTTVAVADTAVPNSGSASVVTTGTTSEPTMVPPPEVAAPTQEAPAEQTPAEETVVPTANVKMSKSVVPESVEAAPVTVPTTAKTAAAKVAAASVGALASVAPVIVSGNPAIGTYGLYGFRIDEADLGAYGVPKSFPITVGSITATITVTVYNNGNGEEFDFTSTWPISTVVAKGGPLGANVYSYDPPVASDTGLHTPMNLVNGFYSAISHLDFYFGAPASITAYKFNDLDRDGVYDEGEPYLSGWDLQLKSGSTVVKSGTTDSNGKVVFSGIGSGAYTVAETAKDGWVVTNDTYPVPVTVAAGDEKVVKLGNAQVVDLTVLKYQDLNANGVRDDGEPALSGWTINLLKNGDVVATEVTDGNGTVVFSGLVPGAYAVSEVLTTGWYNTTALPVDVTLVGGQDQQVEIGNARYPGLSVLKFLDVDRDGIRDEGEQVLSGWTFQLKVEGQVVYSAVTGNDGVAHFSNVEPGAYDLYEVLSGSWFATTELPIAVTMAPNLDQSLEVGNSLTVTKTFELTYPALPAGGSVMVEYAVDGGEPTLVALTDAGGGLYTFDTDVFYNSTISGRWVLVVGQDVYTLATFGPETLTEDLTNTFTYQSVIGGLKYGDDNANGVRDEGEAGLPGWTINLYRMVDGEPVFYGSTVTGEGGAYAFVGLPPGTYTVAEVLQTGWVQTDAPEGSVTISGESQQALGLEFGNTEFAPFPPEPNTSIDKSADTATADPGDLITYTLTYKNTGDTDLEKVTITDDYDQRYMTPVDVGDGVVADGKIAWDRFNLLVGETRTITYTMRVAVDMPDGTTVVDNTAVINPFGDSDTWRVTVENPSLPFTEDEDFLPFTGAEWTLMGLAVLLAIAAGLAFRRMAKTF